MKEDAKGDDPKSRMCAFVAAIRLHVILEVSRNTALGAHLLICPGGDRLRYNALIIPDVPLLGSSSKHNRQAIAPA